METMPPLGDFRISSIVYSDDLPWQSDSEPYEAYNLAFYYSLGVNRGVREATGNPDMPKIDPRHFATQYARWIDWRYKQDPRPKHVSVYNFLDYYRDDADWTVA